MARTLYMNDGSTEYVFAGMTEEDVLRKIIYERLGRDCEELFTEILEEIKGEHVSGDDYEKIADGYRNNLVNVMNDLEEALQKPRLNRKRIEEIYNEVRREV